MFPWGVLKVRKVPSKIEILVEVLMLLYLLFYRLNFNRNQMQWVEVMHSKPCNLSEVKWLKSKWAKKLIEMKSVEN